LDPGYYVIGFVSLFWRVEKKKLSIWLGKHTKVTYDISKPFPSVFISTALLKKI
jgi:hypothetical protein